MAVDSKHPLYIEQEPDWKQMRDTYGGERPVKQARFLYLPPTSGMQEDGLTFATQDGSRAYEAYRKRARYPDVVSEAVEALLGVMHRKPATIELPAQMESLRDNATAQNESLQALLQRVTEEQLVTGRVGLLGDVIDSGVRSGELYLAMYEGDDVINWDEGRSDGIEVQNLNLVVIDETEFERLPEFEWEEQQKYRILQLLQPGSTGEETIPPEPGDSGSGASVVNLPQGEGVYQFGVTRDTNATVGTTDLTAPAVRGRTLDVIPFVFINSKDIVSEPDDPPLLGLSNLALAIYRGEADYRQALFMQGQDTLVVAGGNVEDRHRTGAGAAINLTLGGTAEFIGVNSMGLTEMRMALENDYQRADGKGGQLLENQQGEKESGEALRVRIAAKTTTLVQIAQAAAAGLQRILRILGKWLGLSEEVIATIVVKPNIDFVDDRLSGQAITEYMASKQLGAPLSLRTIFELMQDRGLTERTFEEELAEMKKELEMEVVQPPAPSSDPNGPESDEEEEEEEEPEPDTEE